MAAEIRGGAPRAHAGLPPGRGRGSSVSSIICYLIGLSHVDPVKTNLFLGRFLNETATAVWQRLDGQTSAEEIATDLRYDSNVVIMAIDHLQSAHLLKAKDPSLVSRRSAVRKVARLAAAGVVLPVVSSIAAPTPAMALSGCSSSSSCSGTLI